MDSIINRLIDQEPSLTLSEQLDVVVSVADELLEALEGLCAHLWDNRKRDVKKDYSLMVAEVAAQEAIRTAKGQGR